MRDYVPGRVGSRVGGRVGTGMAVDTGLEPVKRLITWLTPSL